MSFESSVDQSSEPAQVNGIAKPVVTEPATSSSSLPAIAQPPPPNDPDTAPASGLPAAPEAAGESMSQSVPDIAAPVVASEAPSLPPHEPQQQQQQQEQQHDMPAPPPAASRVNSSSSLTVEPPTPIPASAVPSASANVPAFTPENSIPPPPPPAVAPASADAAAPTDAAQEAPSGLSALGESSSAPNGTMDAAEPPSVAAATGPDSGVFINDKAYGEAESLQTDDAAPASAKSPMPVKRPADVLESSEVVPDSQQQQSQSADQDNGEREAKRQRVDSGTEESAPVVESSAVEKAEGPTAIKLTVAPSAAPLEDLQSGQTSEQASTPMLSAEPSPAPHVDSVPAASAPPSVPAALEGASAAPTSTSAPPPELPTHIAPGAIKLEEPQSAPASSMPTPSLETSNFSSGAFGQTTNLPALPSTSSADPAAVNGAEEHKSAPTEAAVPAFTRDQHKWASNLVRTLKKNKSAPPFLRPVDPVLQNVPDYFRFITEPMDLGTAESKLNATGKGLTSASKLGRIYGVDYSGNGQWEGNLGPGSVYRTIEDFKQDLDRIWGNCYRYNGPRENNPVSAMAGVLQDSAERAWPSRPRAPLVDASTPTADQVKRERKKSAVPAPAHHAASSSAFPSGVSPAALHQQPFTSSSAAAEASTSSRPRRETHAPQRDLPYLEASQDGSRSRTGRLSGKQAQEQLRFCKEVVKEMFKKVHEPFAFPFYQPVDYIALNIPSYPSVIKKPMDMGTIRHKLENAAYGQPVYDNFEADWRLMFSNCKAFNPIGTPVREMGDKVEDLFYRKWDERPMHTSDSGMLDDDEEFEDNPQISLMERQLALMQANLEAMKQQGAKGGEKRKSLSSSTSMPKPSKSLGSSQRKSFSGASGDYKPPKPQQPKRKSISGSDALGSSQKKKPRKSNASESDEDETVTFDMKRELAVRISNFEGDQLERAIDIIRRARPDLLGNDNQEIELDIDQLDQRTLLSLYRFVCPRRGPKNKNKSKTAAAGRRTGTGGLNRKNLDEDKESQRIADLEARLANFDQGGGMDPRRSASAAANPIMDDRASSDSSSEDEGSESGSDDEP